jgi:octaprenyl-diphosphate synthase
MQRPAYTEVPGHIPWSSFPAFGLIDCQLGRVRELIAEQLTIPARVREIKPLLECLSPRSDKMIRSGLVLFAGSCCGKITDEHIRIAAIVEMIHNATLLHDGVIDRGQKRGGLPTVNSLWSNESAVLLGDFLLSRAFKICAELEPQVTRVIAATAIRVCEGELRQVTQRQNWQLSESEYIDIITEKSAALFSGCCYLGGLVARASEAQVQSLDAEPLW